MLKTALNSYHHSQHGKMVDFAGWEMPLTYAWTNPDGSAGGGITAEHVQTRTSGGFFDVSHMGRLKVHGRQAGKLLEKLCTRRVRDMKPGVCRYALLCNAQGGIHDDIIVYRMEEDDFLVVCNASNREKVIAHINAVKDGGGFVASLEDLTSKTAMVAVQGPRVIEFISAVSKEIPGLKRYTFAVKNLLIAKLIVSRTGYTGEDGVEVILPAGMIDMAMTMIMKKAPEGLIRPCGLGARDTLRLEAGMPLYGHELTEETNALGTGLDFAIALDKEAVDEGEAFVGADALKRSRDSGGPPTKLVGLKVDGKRSARQGMKVIVGGREAGVVTSGAPSPTLGVCIAMAYVPSASSTPGVQVESDTGKGDRLGATVCALPFYKAPKVEVKGVGVKV
ncbi:MAG: glycine cleavage system aminomethyltransferase GcvT [bacterium]